jgi:nucleotide-binding universal stress UspA family protein
MQTERYRRVVLATDGSENAGTATDFLAALEWPDGTAIVVVGVCTASIPPGSDALPDTGVEQDARRYLELVRQEELERTRGFVAQAAAALRERRPGIAVEEVVRSGEPAAEILAQVREIGADLIVAGARGHTVLRSLLLGSVSEALVTEAPCPVLIVRGHHLPAVDGRVLVGIGLHDDVDRLANALLRLPLPAGTRVVAASVEAAPGGGSAADDPEIRRLAETMRDWTAAAESEARAAARHLAERLRAAAPDLVVEPRLLAGDVASELLATAVEIGADLIVVGARERRGMTARLGLGSVSRKLVRRAEHSVLVVRHDPSAGEDGAAG